MVKAILIDDEVHCLETLSILIHDYCPEVQVIQQCKSAKEGLEVIAVNRPDLLFLDIEMPSMNGFELLQQLGEIPFSVIFTTSYDQYAIKAIHLSALDYLLKPIDPKELVAAVHKAARMNKPPSADQFQLLINRIQNNETGFNKIAVPTVEGFELVSVFDIKVCEADDNYTYLHLKNKKKITACRTLKEVAEMLSSFPSFVRVHHSFIANLNEVTKYVRGEGGYLVMSDSTIINVSRSRKETLLKYF